MAAVTTDAMLTAFRQGRELRSEHASPDALLSEPFAGRQLGRPRERPNRTLRRVTLARRAPARTLFEVTFRLTPMSSAAKQLLREALDHVPDDATVEDVMERLYLLAKVARGLEAADRGDVVPHDEIEREFLAGG
jgi:predicted transcriptional regulator